MLIADGPLTCPRCADRMERIETAGIAVDRCATCHALWLGLGERARLIAAGKASEVDLGPAASSMLLNEVGGELCPRDRARLVTMTDMMRPHVMFEQCSICGGVLLDGGELADLAEHAAGERLHRLLGLTRATR